MMMMIAMDESWRKEKEGKRQRRTKNTRGPIDDINQPAK